MDCVGTGLRPVHAEQSSAACSAGALAREKPPVTSLEDVHQPWSAALYQTKLRVLGTDLRVGTRPWLWRSLCGDGSPTRPCRAKLAACSAGALAREKQQ